jgi:alpha-mannosidase
MKRYKQAIEQSERLLESAIAGLASKIRHNPDETSFVVFNPLPWTRTDVVRTLVDISTLAHDFFDLQGPDGESIAYQISSASGANPIEVTFIAKDMPSLGHRVYRIVGTEKRPDFDTTMKVGSSWAESSEYILEFDEFSGAISRLYDKKANVEVLNGISNFLTSESDVGDLYRFSAPEFAGDVSEITSVRTPGALKLVESGPVRSVFEVISEFDNSTKRDRITIYEGIHRIDFEMSFDFQSRNRRVRLNFLLPIYEKSVAVGSQFGSESRMIPTTEETLNDQVSQFSVLDWVDCMGPEFGVCLSAPGLHEFSFTDGVLQATILRSVDYLSHGLDDDVVETRTAREQGEHNYRYMIHSHIQDCSEAGIWRVSAEHRLPLIAYPLDDAPGQYDAESHSITVEGVDLAVSSVRSRGMENSIIVRFYEPVGKSGMASVSFVRSIERAELVDLLEREIGELKVNGKSVEVPVDAHSIITLRVNFKESRFSA